MTNSRESSNHPLRQQLSKSPTYLVLILIASGYMFIWLLNFRHIYPTFWDDIYVSYANIIANHQNPVGFNFYLNVAQSYYYFVTYLPYQLGISLPGSMISSSSLASSSDPQISLLGSAYLGQARFLMLWFIGWHSVVLLLLGLFFYWVTEDGVVTVFATLLVATSVNFITWTPRLDSRLVGLMYVIPGIWLLLSQIRYLMEVHVRVNRPVFFWSGVLFGIAFTIHYNALYLIVPFMFAYLLTLIILLYKQYVLLQSLIQAFFIFILGCYLIPGVYDFIHWVILKRPLLTMPTLSYYPIFFLHNNGAFSGHQNFLEKLSLWNEGIVSQWGMPLAVAIIFGLFFFFFSQRTMLLKSTVNARMLVLAITCITAVLILLFMPPMFRMTGSFAPLFFLFVAYGVINLIRKLNFGSSQAVGTVSILVLGGLLGARPILQSIEVFQSYLSLGKTLEWVDENCKNQRVLFVPNVAINPWNESQGATFNSCLVSASPLWLFDWEYTTSLEKAAPTHSSLSYWGTENCYIEGRGYNNPDWRGDTLNGTIRVYRLGDVLQPLPVQSIESDSFDQSGTPDKVFFAGQIGESSDTAWISSNRLDSPHYIEILFSKPEEIASVVVFNRPGTYVKSLDVIVKKNGKWQMVSESDVLEHSDKIRLGWLPIQIEGIRFVVRKTVDGSGVDTEIVAIEEIVFPGFIPIFPNGQDTSVTVKFPVRYLTIQSLETDSEFGIGYTKEKVFDLRRSADSPTSWASADTPMPHFLTINFQSPVRLSQMRVLNGAYTRIDQLEVQFYYQGIWTTVFNGSGLKEQQFIDINWIEQEMVSIRVLVKREFLLDGQERNTADIEEITFPGYNLVVMEAK